MTKTVPVKFSDETWKEIEKTIIQERFENTSEYIRSVVRADLNTRYGLRTSSEAAGGS